MDLSVIPDTSAAPQASNRDWLWEIIVCPMCQNPVELGPNETEVACTNHACGYKSKRAARKIDLLPLELDSFQKAEDRFRLGRYEGYDDLFDWQSESQRTRFRLLNVSTDYIFHSQYHFFRDSFVKRHQLYGRGLEIGGGTGQQSGFIKLFFPQTEMVMSDVAPTNIVIGEQLADLFHWDIDYFVACDAQRLPFRPNSFDFVFSSAVLHHLGDLKAGLNQVCSVLKPGGKWYIVNELAIGALPRLFWNSRWGQKGQTARRAGIHENSYTLPEWRRFFAEQQLEIVQTYFHRNAKHKLRSWSSAAYYALISMLPVRLLEWGIPCEICFVLEKPKI